MASSRSVAAALPHGSVLGARFATSAGGLDARRVLLLAAAALAILLLGLASLPSAVLVEPRLAALVATRRGELALAGTATLLTAVLVYVFAGS